MRCRLYRIVLFAFVAVTSLPFSAGASPNVPLDDPSYVELARLRALGLIPLYTGGVRPLTEATVQRLLLAGGESASPNLLLPSVKGLWFAPLRRMTTRLILASDELSPYVSQNVTTNSEMAGGVEISCEHQEGRACGSGAGLIGELDSAAGYGKWVSAFSRLSLVSGTDNYSLAAAVDRLYVNGEVGPVALEAGRDVLMIGPGVHTQLMWGDHAPPFDHVRLSTAHPIKIPRIPMAVSAFYAIGRLRDPQAFHNTLADLARLQVDLFNQVEIGAAQLMQFDGEGGPPALGFGEFIVEHFTRSRGYKYYVGPDSSNRRDSLDVTYTARWARGLRAYYEIVFEDFRRQFVDMLVYDCDHLVGLELPALTREGRHGLVLEYQHNGPVSQTHTTWVTGMTNAGRAVGSPLGPNSWSLYAATRLDLPKGAVVPSLEIVRRTDAQYNFAHSGVYLVREGISESRVRLGARAWLRLRQHLRAQLRFEYEHVVSANFVPAASQNNLVLETALVWEPEIPLAR
jgi:hypothetical protein